MSGWAYLASLLVSLAGMVALDRRFRLVLWADRRRGLIVLGICLAFFLAWDAAAIVAGIYGVGPGSAATGILLAPELPLEEPFFIVFLGYLTLVLHGLIGRAVGRVLPTASERP